MLSLIDLNRLREMKPLKFDGSGVVDFNLYLKNNLNENVRKGSTRTESQVYSDTAKGMGFEDYLFSSGLFEQAAPAVEDARTIVYSLRQKDFFYNSTPVQVKTITKLHGNWAYLSDSMHASIQKSTKHNDFFIFGLASIEGDRNAGSSVFIYQPAFAISTPTLKLSIREQDGGTYVNLDGLSRRPDHYQAIHKELI